MDTTLQASSKTAAELNSNWNSRFVCGFRLNGFEMDAGTIENSQPQQLREREREMTTLAADDIRMRFNSTTTFNLIDQFLFALLIALLLNPHER